MLAEDFKTASGLIQRGYNYWRRKAGSRRAPTWREIEPAEIVELLPNVVVVHVLRDPLDFVERITGQTVVDNSHRNSMGVRWRDFPGRGPESRIWQVMAEVVTSKQPSFQDIPYVGPHSDFLRLQTVICPISDDGFIVNKTLAFVDFLPC